MNPMPSRLVALVAVAGLAACAGKRHVAPPADSPTAASVSVGGPMPGGMAVTKLNLNGKQCYQGLTPVPQDAAAPMRIASGERSFFSGEVRPGRYLLRSDRVVRASRRRRPCWYPSGNRRSSEEGPAASRCCGSSPTARRSRKPRRALGQAVGRCHLRPPAAGGGTQQLRRRFPEGFRGRICSTKKRSPVSPGGEMMGAPHTAAGPWITVCRERRGGCRCDLFSLGKRHEERATTRGPAWPSSVVAGGGFRRDDRRGELVQLPGGTLEDRRGRHQGTTGEAGGEVRQRRRGWFARRNSSSDVDSLLAKGANALIILAMDKDAIVPALAKAKQRKVPVVAYDRLIEQPGVFYITFDNKEVGRLQAQGRAGREAQGQLRDDQGLAHRPERRLPARGPAGGARRTPSRPAT